MEQLSGLKSVTLGRYTFTDLDYADDIALPASQLSDLETGLSGFTAAARPMGLNVSWLKTKVQSFEPGGVSSDVIIEGNTVESVKSFCHLGSVQDSSGRCSPDILYRMGIAPSSNGLLVPNLEAGEVVPKYETTSIHDVHRSCSPIRL